MAGTDTSRTASRWGTVEARTSSERVERSATPMPNHTYRVTEIVGTSPDGIDQAIRNGINRASQTLRELDWFEVTQVRGQIVDGQVEHYQVGLKVGFRLEDSD
jgi:flavin-binding protein dodecin